MKLTVIVLTILVMKYASKWLVKRGRKYNSKKGVSSYDMFCLLCNIAIALCGAYISTLV